MKLSRKLPVLLFIVLCFFITFGYLNSTADDTDIPIEGEPRCLAINPNTDQAVVGSVKPNEISVVDMDTEQVISSIGVGKKPLGLAVDSTLNLALIAQKPSHTLSIVSLDTHQVLANISVGKSPCNVAVYEAEGGPHLGLTANYGANTVSVIDLQTFKVIKTISVGIGPRDIAVDPELKLALVVNEDNHNASVIDLNSLRVTGRIPVGRNPRAISINPETHLAAVANGQENFITVINLTNWQTRVIPVDKNPLDIIINPLDNRVLVVCNKSHSLHLIDLDTNRNIQKYSLNKQTRGVAVNPFTNIAGVVDDKTDSLTLIQLPNPIPEINSITPNRIPRGSLGTKLAVEGSGFIKTSTISFQPSISTTLPITFIDNHHLEVNLPSTLFNQAGNFQITINNPAPEGGPSNAKILQIENPVPTLTALDPASASAGGAGLTVAVHGTGFFPETTILVNSLSRPTTFVNGTMLKVSLGSADLATVRSLEIKTSNPAPGGGISGSIPFLVTQTSTVQPLPDGSYGKTYEDLIPANATIPSYDPKRFSLISGLVKDVSGNPLAGVTVGIHSHPEYGTAQTDATGRFSIPVDGGGTVTMDYQKAGFLTAHRQVDVGWNTIANAETIVMIPADNASTALTFDGNAATILTHRSTTTTDAFGSRSLTMVLTGDNRAWVKDDQGIEQPLTNITVRATEYPTPESMPAKLPPTSAFTYCAELSVDNAKSARFDKPIVVYVDNFLGFNVGEIVPVGYYDRDRAVWVPSNNGVVVRLLDTNGDGIVDTYTDGQNQYPAPGLTNPNQYHPNATFWRVELDHFSPWDCNWPFGPTPDAISPNPQGEPTADTKCPYDDNRCINSYVENRSRIFHEDIPISGTDMTLHYASNRTMGYKSKITIPVSGPSVPASLIRIVVKMEVAGKIFETVLPPQPNQQIEFIWDGKDYLARKVIGASLARIHIGFEYPMVYYSGSSIYAQAFAQPGSGGTWVLARENIINWLEKSLTIYQEKGDFAEGWTISPHHFLDPNDPSTLYKGDGKRLSNNIRNISTIAKAKPVGDGVSTLKGLVMDKAGNIYFSDPYNYRYMKLDNTGMITYYSTLNTNIGMVNTDALSLDKDGKLIFTNPTTYWGSFIGRIDSNEMITIIAGNNVTQGFSGDGGLATEAKIKNPSGITFDSNGNLFISDTGNNRIRKVDQNGIITTIAGTGEGGFSGDGGPAAQANLNGPAGIVLDSRGNIYFSDSNNNRIRKVDTSGTISTIAGNGQTIFMGDGGPATEAGVPWPWSLAIDLIGNIYISDGNYYRIRKIDTKGIITTIAGNGERGNSGDGSPATQAAIFDPTGIVVDSTGNVYVASTGLGYIRKVSLPGAFKSLSFADDIIFTDENAQGYVIGSTGIHKFTYDLVTGKTILSFGYDSENRLVSITDRFGNQTTIQRDGSGAPLSITSPDGIVTRLNVNGNNHLTTVTYPDNSAYSFAYTSDGLMTDKYDPKGNRFRHQYDSNGRISNVLDPEGGSWTYSRSVDNSGTATVTMQTAEGNTTTYRDRTDSTGAYTSTTTSPFGSVSTSTRSSDGLTETNQPSCGMNQTMKYDLDTAFKYKYLKEFTQLSPSGLTLIATDTRTYQDTNADTLPDYITKTIGINGRNWTILDNTLTGTLTGTSPLGRTITAQYNPANILTTRRTIPGFYDTVYSYDNKGRLTSLTRNTRVSSFSYNPQGFLGSITDPESNTIAYSYDTIGRVIRLDGPSGYTLNFSYDSNGNMTILTNPSLINHGFGYNAVNLNNSYQTPLSGSYGYLYDKERNLVRVTFPSGILINNIYNQGRLVRTETPEGNIVYNYLCDSKIGNITKGTEGITYTYDGALITSETLSGSLNQTMQYTYNNDFNPASFTYAGQMVNYNYDNDGLLTGAGSFTIGRNATNGLPLSVNGGSLNLSRTFNGYGEENGEAYTIGGQTPLSWSLTRTDTGRISSRAETVDGTFTNYTYTYDPMGRLLSASRDGSIVEQYQYSTNGTRTYEVNALRGIAGRTLAYSAEDHLLTAGNISYQYNLDGFITSKTQGTSTTTYQYSSRGELLSVYLPDGRTIEFLHDPLARRTAKKIKGTITEKYLWQGRTRLLAVYDGSDNLLMRFNYADGRMPISMTKTGATYYLMYDQVGSLKAVTDSAGNVIKKITYDSFGNIVADTNPSFTIPFGFAGGLQDRDTGLVRFGYRDYNPEVGRWTAKDPILFAGGDMNLYSYIQHDPLNWMDPFGLTEQAVLIQQYIQGALSRAGLSASSSLVTIEFPNWFVPPYGRWGGPGRSGPGDPIDSLDECFRAHDKNYEKFGINDWKVNNSQIKDRKGCDKEVKNCISKLSFNPLLWKNWPPWWMPIEYATLYRIGSQGLFWLMSR